MAQQGRPSARDTIVNNVILPAVLTERDYPLHDAHYIIIPQCMFLTPST